MITIYMGRQRKMSESIFIDTSALIALIDNSDSLHRQAGIAMSQIGKSRSRMVTTEFILMEVANALSRQPFRKCAIDYLNGLRHLKTINIFPASTELLHSGWLLYCDRSDKEWSLTDCISFEVMMAEGITKAFTSDHHFEQAGFTKLI